MTEDVTEAPAESSQADETQADTLARFLSESTTDEVVEETVDEQEDDADEVEEEVEEVSEGDEDNTEEQEEVAILDAPDNWSKKEKEQYDAMPDEYKTIINEKYDSMLKDYKSKTSEISGMKKDNELWGMVFDDDARGQLKLVGQNPQQYVTGLMEFDRAITSDPASGIKALMKHVGITAKDLGLIAESEPSEDDYDFDNDVEVKVTKPEPTNNTDARNAVDIERQVLEFQYAEDENGKRLHPHFTKEVEGEMQVLFATKRAKTLVEAYALSPTVKELENLAKEKGSKDKLSTIKKKTAKAMKAASSVKNRTTNSVRTDHSDMTQREIIASKLRQASG